jgi:hypothetical protein
MGTLPSGLSRGTVAIHGEEVPIRAMSRLESIALTELEGQEAREIHLIRSGTDCSEEEARAFLAGNDVDDSNLLIAAIAHISKLANPIGLFGIALKKFTDDEELTEAEAALLHAGIDRLVKGEASADADPLADSPLKSESNGHSSRELSIPATSS